MSADVAGYSRLMAADELATILAITAHRELAGRLTERHGGRLVDSPGDNFLFEFPGAAHAVRCAFAFQLEAQQLNRDLPPEQQMRFRIGVHVGEVTEHGDRIYGSGINVAARLERLARAGGICVSRDVQEELAGEPYELEDIGEQRVKNIPEPVHAFFVRVPGEERRPPTSSDLASRPAIAVLPFDNMSDDPEQEYFADGICEDLLTSLAIWRQFPVIARNSSFVYKGRPVDVKKVGRELGAGYVVEGSVRKAGGRLRITAQVIDAATGLHVWADRWEGDLGDVFSLQDEITQAIAVAIHPQLVAFESERAVRRPPSDLGAWDLALRGVWHLNRKTKADNQRARELLQRSLGQDPDSVFALANLANSHYQDMLHNWTDDRAETIRALAETTQRAVLADPRDSQAHLLAGLALLVQAKREDGMQELRLAVDLNPSLPAAHSVLGQFLALSGSPDDGVAELELAIRLSPRDPALWTFYTGLALAHFAADRLEESARCAEQGARLNPEAGHNWACIASTAALLGQTERAAEAMGTLRRVAPTFSVGHVRAMLASGTAEANERFLEGLRRAGLQE